MWFRDEFRSVRARAKVRSDSLSEQRRKRVVLGLLVVAAAMLGYSLLRKSQFVDLPAERITKIFMTMILVLIVVMGGLFVNESRLDSRAQTEAILRWRRLRSRHSVWAKLCLRVSEIWYRHVVELEPALRAMRRKKEGEAIIEEIKPLFYSLLSLSDVSLSHEWRDNRIHLTTQVPLMQLTRFRRGGRISIEPIERLLHDVVRRSQGDGISDLRCSVHQEAESLVVNIALGWVPRPGTKRFIDGGLR